MAPNSTAVCRSLYSTFKWTLLREVKRKQHKKQSLIKNKKSHRFLKHSQKQKGLLNELNAGKFSHWFAWPLSHLSHFYTEKKTPKRKKKDTHAEKSGWAKVKGQWVARYWSGELRETSQTMVGWWGQEFGLAFNIMKTC